MPSPFPGMDPYLEAAAHWEGFHQVFIVECMYLLSNVLPEGYIADVGERVELMSVDDEAARQYMPGVAVTQARPPVVGRLDTGRGGTAIAAAPITIPSIDMIEIREPYVNVLRLPDHELVTSVELLSPWNKFGEGVGEYRSKRRALVSRRVHVVEIDLLTRGRRTELARPLPAGDYFAFVFRGDKHPNVDVYAWGIRQPLPTIAVPLRAPDADVPLDLGAVVATAYDRGRYQRKLQYQAPLPSQLSPEDAAWATDLARRVSAG